MLLWFFCQPCQEANIDVILVCFQIIPGVGNYSTLKHKMLPTDSCNKSNHLGFSGIWLTGLYLRFEISGM